MSAKTLILAACGLAIAAPLAACGLEGDLNRPGPLYGSAARRQYEQDRVAGRSTGTPETDAAAPRPTSPSSTVEDAPRTTRDIQDPAQKLTPLPTSPVDGVPNPLGAPVSTRPPGA